MPEVTRFGSPAVHKARKTNQIEGRLLIVVVVEKEYGQVLSDNRRGVMPVDDRRSIGEWPGSPLP
jgi:hypothetical protein